MLKILQLLDDGHGRSIESSIRPRPVDAWHEAAAYESLWENDRASFKQIAGLFRAHPGSLPSDLVPESVTIDYLRRFRELAEAGELAEVGIRVHGAEEYPPRLRDAEDPVELFYYTGWWDLAFSPKSIAVVGSRMASDEGLRRTKKLVRQLVSHGYTIVSGLAKGVDTAAHEATIDEGGRTIAVLGTPITDVYPPENRGLQSVIADRFLMISQVPIFRYRRGHPGVNRWFFPERNKTMSALTDATVIVEAGETSGTLTQARAAFQQGRKLFILDNCFKNTRLTWPAKFASRGAIRVRDVDDILSALEEDRPGDAAH